MLDLDRAFREAAAPGPSEQDKQSERTANIQELVYGIVGRYGEFFAEPDNRLEFIKGQSAKDFFRISQYVNAKVRGEKARELRQRPEERRGGSLPMLHTPKSSDKLPAFSRGFDAMQEYLEATDDSIDKQVEGIAMATEALIRWVHPFADGNGRTSRFMAKLIEDGAADMDALTEETVASKARPLSYSQKLKSKESELADANNEDIMLDDDKRDAMRANAKALPNDIEVMYLSVTRLLDDDSIRQSILDKAEEHRAAQRKHEMV